jgi:hypothetical protein
MWNSLNGEMTTVAGSGSYGILDGYVSQSKIQSAGRMIYSQNRSSIVLFDSLTHIREITLSCPNGNVELYCYC